MRSALLSLRAFLALLRSMVVSASQSVLQKVTLHKRHLLLRGILIGFAISLLVTLLALLGHFKPYENGLTDLLQDITRKKAGDVTLLFITDHEYKRGFGGISPLSRKRLAEMLRMLVKLEARVIALDFDLSDRTPEDRSLLQAIGEASKANIPVVLAALPRDMAVPTTPSGDREPRPYPEDPFQSTAGGFGLFEGISPGSQWLGADRKVLYGGVVSALDADGVFRDAEALYKVRNAGSDKSGPRLVPSFPLAVAAAYQGMSQQALEQTLSHLHDQQIALSGQGKGHEGIHVHVTQGGRMVPNFIGNHRNFDWNKGAEGPVELSQLLEIYGAAKARVDTVYKDRIVIVGGVFDNKDFYLTPVGRMSGMEVLANVAQNIIGGNLITHMNFWKAFGLEVLLGTLVAMVFVLTSRGLAMLICALTLIPAVTVASLLAFANAYYWFDFIPTIAGVALHGWWSGVEKSHERERRPELLDARREH